MIRFQGCYLKGHPDRIRWLLDQPGWKWLTHRRSHTGETDATRRAHWEQVWREQTQAPAPPGGASEAPSRAEAAEAAEAPAPEEGARHLGKRKRRSRVDAAAIA